MVNPVLHLLWANTLQSLVLPNCPSHKIVCSILPLSRASSSGECSPREEMLSEIKRYGDPHTRQHAFVSIKYITGINL